MSDALYEQYPVVYDALYAEKPYDIEVEFVTEYVEAGDRVLVVGCGTGEHSRRLVDAPAEIITETLEARGLETEIVEGYGASGEWPATVVVANYGKS